MKLAKFGIHIKVKDFNKSLKFYLDFGFKPVFCYGDEKLRSMFKDIPSAAEKYRGITFEVESALFEIGEDHPAVKKEVFLESIRNSKVSAMIDVESVAEVRKICEREEYEIAKAEVDYPWGTRELVVRDPDGFILVFREKNY